MKLNINTGRVPLCLFALLAVAWCAAGARAQDPATDEAQPMPGRLVPQAQQTGEWTLFSSPEAGIELKMPPGTSQVSDDPNVLAVVADAERKWRFELRRLPLDRPMDLQPEEMPEGGRRAGLLELMASSAQQATPESDILRKDLTPLGDADAGVYVL